MAVKAEVGGAQRELSSVLAGVNGVSRSLSSWQGCVGGVNRELLKPPTKYELAVRKVEFVQYTDFGGPGTPEAMSWEWTSGGIWGNYALKVIPLRSAVQGWAINVYGAFDASLVDKTINFVIAGSIPVGVYLFNVYSGIIEEWQVSGSTEGGFGEFSGQLHANQNELLMSLRGDVFSGSSPINIYMSSEGHDISEAK